MNPPYKGVFYTITTIEKAKLAFDSWEGSIFPVFCGKMKVDL